MKITEAVFVKSCKKTADFPAYDLPEFAFFGRSNVGKSSLINMLCGKKDLVKTGSRPGVTRMINFFLCNNSISLADCPGYGYSKLPKEIRDSFMPLIRGYVSKRKNLRLAFLLIDVRRIPDSFELDILEFLTKHKIPVAITLTKCDKLSKNQRIKNRKKITGSLGVNDDSLFFTSAKSGEGKREILGLIGEFKNGKSY